MTQNQEKKLVLSFCNHPFFFLSDSWIFQIEYIYKFEMKKLLN